MHECEYCEETFNTLSRLRLHKDDCDADSTFLNDERVIAFSKVGVGSEFQSLLDKRRNRLTEHDIYSIEEAVEELRSQIATFGVEDFIQELWYHELIRASSYDTLGEDTGIPPKLVEYLFGLATTVDPTENRSKSIDFYDIIDSLSLVYDQIQLDRSEILADADSSKERRRAFVQYLQIERELTTGRFAHGEQRRQFTKQVYSKIDEELSTILGFSASEAISCTEAINRYHERIVTNAQLAPIAAHVINCGEGPFQVDSKEIIQKAYRNPSAGLPLIWVKIAEYDHHRLNPLTSEHEVGDYPQCEKSFGNIREVAPDISFTVADIYQEVDQTPTALEGFLEEFGVGFGDYPSDVTDHTGTATKFDYPFDHNPLHRTPFLRNRHSSYYLGPRNSTWYSLSTRFRYDILGSEHEGSATEKIGEAIEEWVVDCFNKIDDSDVEILGGVDYDFEDGESDVVLLFDETVVVVEVKTRGLRLNSRLGPYGSFEQLREDAAEIIQTPYEDQVMKLINGIKRGDVTELKSGDRTVHVSSDRFSRYIPIIVLSQPLDFVGTVLHVDLLNFDHEYPYITDVYSLQTLSESLTYSAQLLEYLNRRIEIGVTGRAFSIDEMDYVGEFLEHRLEYPEIPDGAVIDITHAGSHLERIYD